MSLERMKRVIGILIGLLPFFRAYFAPQPLAVARHNFASANQNLLQKKTATCSMSNDIFGIIPNVH